MKLLKLVLRVIAIAAFLIVGVVLVMFYSTRNEYYRRVNAQESLRYALEVAKASSAYYATTGRTPKSIDVLGILPEQPLQLAGLTFIEGTGVIRIRIADVPDDANLLDLIPTKGADGRLEYACHSVNIPVDVSPSGCKLRTEELGSGR